MAEIFKFFNSAPGDERWHYASDFADYFGGVLSDGILHTDKNVDLGLRVNVVNGTLTTKIAPGKAIIKGYAYENTTDLTLKHDIPEPTLKRIDRIVLRLDLSNSSRYVKLFVKKGASATSPIAPTLQRDQYIHELSLAQVLVRENTTQLLASDLKDERMIESLCGLVSSIISVPTTQFQEQWDTWFESVKNEGFAPYTDTGFKENLKTTDKTNLVNAINEVFISGNNVKKNVVDTLLSLDSTLPITINSGWSNIISALPNISGKSPMNVYIQTTEPTKKEGIWFNTDNPLDTEDYKLSNNGVNINLTLDTSRMQMPFKSTAFASVYYNDAIYVLVGNVYKYDIKNNVWGVVSTAPSPGANSNDAVLYGDDIYVQIGTTDFYKYNISKNTWTKLADLPFTQPATYTLVNGYIYTIGGSYYSTYYSYVYKYNIATNTWTKLKDMAETSNQHKAVALGTNIYVGPLVTSYDSNFNKYDTLTDTWTKVANMPLNLRAFGILAIGTCVYIFGGIINSWGTASNTIYKYDTITGTWSGVGSMYSTYWGLNAIYNNDILFLMGGYDTSRSDYVGLNHSYSVKFTDLIKGVTIDQSYFKYATQFLNAKGYTSLGRITSQFKLAYLSVDGKIPKFNVPTYYGNGSNWVKTDIN